MRKISPWLFIFAFTIFTLGLARAQDAATQQQIDKLSGQIQDLQDATALQDKRIGALEKQVADLSDKLNQPAANNYASADDLKKLAEQVQEIDKKRQDDNDLILKQLEKLARVSGGTTNRKPPPMISPTASSTNNSTASGPQKGYEYEVKSGDTLSAIAKACRAQGVKVTVGEIQAANPGLDPKNLIVGKKIFIPAPQ